MSSNLANYQAILESTFFNFLQKQGASEKTRKNYLSDLRHFLNWTAKIIQSLNIPLPPSLQSFLANLTPKVFQAYKEALIAQLTPVTTINRRLSTIRTFIKFCQTQQWIGPNFKINITNVTSHKNDQTQNLLNSFENNLLHSGASKVTIKNYLSDVRQFLAWLNKNNF